MLSTRQTRTLLGPADPARHLPPPTPALTAAELIHLADGTPAPTHNRRVVRTTRRLLVTSAVAVLAIGATAAFRTFAPPGGGQPSPYEGIVLAPIGTEFNDDSKPAGPELRAIADRLVDAPYEHHLGDYAYHRTRTWGDGMLTSADGRYHVAHVAELEKWQRADGDGHQINTLLRPEYPDVASRDYWRKELDVPLGVPQDFDIGFLGPVAPLPTTRDALADVLGVKYGEGNVPKLVTMVYGKYVVPLQTRAEILRILADLPGFTWRGTVRDRAGRDGVAISFYDREHDYRHLLIFEPNTGVLLAWEMVAPGPGIVTLYVLNLDTDRRAGRD